MARADHHAAFVLSEPLIIQYRLNGLGNVAHIGSSIPNLVSNLASLAPCHPASLCFAHLQLFGKECSRSMGREATDMINLDDQDKNHYFFVSVLGLATSTSGCLALLAW